MTKEQIGKEIKELIRSIKTHYTFVEEEDRIPLIELELITSKIRKLYEKSIINNYLHSNDETYMSHERSRRFGERRSFERNTPDTFVNKVVGEAQSITEPVSQSVEVERPNPDTISAPFINEIKKADATTNANNNMTSVKALKDLKLLIGINDKFLLINNLFARNDADYKIVIEHLSSLRTYEDALDYMKGLAHKFSWNLESYAFVRFLQIIEKRHK